MARKPAVIPRNYALPHLRIDHFAEALNYQPPRPHNRPGEPDGRERFPHGTKLAVELAQAIAAAQHQRQLRNPSIAVGKPNAYFEVASDIDKMLPEKGWRQDVRVGAVRRDPSGAQVGTLFVTKAGEKILSDAITTYTGSTATSASTKRIDQIERIAPGTVASLWMDLRALPEAGQRIWWECWCWPETAANLLRPAQRLGLRVSEQRLHFPDFEVVPVYASVDDMERLLANTDAIEELRHASDTPHVYMHALAAYRKDVLTDLVARVARPPSDAPATCILDTGVAHAHPLLSPSLAADDCHAVDDAWHIDDHHGHGTEMAGMALYGDLTYPVGDQRSIALNSPIGVGKAAAAQGLPAEQASQSRLPHPERHQPAGNRGAEIDRVSTPCRSPTMGSPVHGRQVGVRQ